MRGNQITLHLNGDAATWTGNLYQYDRGQRVVFTGADLPETYQVHFSNEELGISKPVIGDATGADIPDEYLVSGQPVHIWVYVTGEDHAETEYHGVIGVIRRAEPTDAGDQALSEKCFIDGKPYYIHDCLDCVEDVMKGWDDEAQARWEQRAKESEYV